MCYFHVKQNVIQLKFKVVLLIYERLLKIQNTDDRLMASIKR